MWPSKRNLLIVFIEEHFIQFFILSNYKAINVLSGELYQGDPDLYWAEMSSTGVLQATFETEEEEEEKE